MSDDTSQPQDKPRRRVPRTVGRVALVVVVATLALALHTAFARPLWIDAFFFRYALVEALHSPETLTYAGVLESFGIRGHNGRLDDVSDAASRAYFERTREHLRELHGYDREALAPTDRENYDVLDTMLRDALAAEPFCFHYYRFNPTGSVQDDLTLLMTDYQHIDDARDAELYVERLRAFPQRFDDERAHLEAQWARGIRPQRFLVDNVLASMRAFVSHAPEHNALYIAFVEKLGKVPAEDLDARERRALLASARDALTTSVYPAYRKVIAWFEHIQPQVTRNDGAWALPDGAAYYAYAIREHTGLATNAEQLHATGLRDVARLGARMDALLRGLGYTEGKIGARVRAFAGSPGQIYPDTDAGRQAILRDYRAIAARAKTAVRPWFSHMPRAPLEVRAVPQYAAATAPVGYYAGPQLAGDSPGTFYVNLLHLDAVPRFTMATLVHHEAVPGHHMQIALAIENDDLPLFRKWAGFTAYDEGWALYAERLAGELGLTRAPADDLGRLQAEMFRAVRLVVDTGMHARRWTREQAVTYLIDNTGMSDDEVSDEIDRYLVDPGQALAYKVGMSTILRLRESARTRLGDRFDLAAFHKAVLDSGSVPLPVLEANVQRYVERVLATAR